jgi:hypothetical protein
MGTVVQEQVYNWEKSRVKWDLSRLSRDLSEEQALFNGVVLNVLKKKVAYRFGKIEVQV